MDWFSLYRDYLVLYGLEAIGVSYLLAVLFRQKDSLSGLCVFGFGMMLGLDALYVGVMAIDFHLTWLATMYLFLLKASILLLWMLYLALVCRMIRHDRERKERQRRISLVQFTSGVLYLLWLVTNSSVLAITLNRPWP